MKITTLLPTLTLLILALAVTPTLDAQEGPEKGRGFRPDGETERHGRLRKRKRGERPRRHQGFAQLDQNGDGLLSQKEAPQLFEAMPKADTNGDGQLSKEEVRAGQLALREKRRAEAETRRLEHFQRLDKDGNGVLSQDEWKERRGPFERIDADGNGSISYEELTEARKKMAQHRRKRRGQGMARERLARHDKNGDGAISREDFPGDDERFKRLDRNGDGVIDRKDRRQREGQGKRARPRHRKPEGRGGELGKGRRASGEF